MKRDDDGPIGLTYSLGFLARTAGLSALACGVGLAILRWVFSRELGTEYARAFYTLKNLLDFLVPALVFCLLAVLLLASVAVFGVALFASHKVAGPLFRLQRVAGYLSRRVLVGRIHLRLGDQGKPVAAAINGWVAARTERLRRLRAAADESESALRACERALDRGDVQGLRGELGRLLRCAGAFRNDYS